MLIDFDGHTVESPEDSADLLVGDCVGREVRLRVLRGGTASELPVTIGMNRRIRCGCSLSARRRTARRCARKSASRSRSRGGSASLAAGASDIDADAIVIAHAQSDEDESFNEPLTPREVQVVELLAEGLPNKAIAARLGISDQTVKFHLGVDRGQLGAANRTDTVRRAARRGLIAL